MHLSINGKWLRVLLVVAATALSGLTAGAASFKERLARGESALSGQVLEAVLHARDQEAVRAALSRYGLQSGEESAVRAALPGKFREEPAVWAEVYRNLRRAAAQNRTQAPAPDTKRAVATAKVAADLGRRISEVRSNEELDRLFDGNGSYGEGDEQSPAPAAPAPAPEPNGEAKAQGWPGRKPPPTQGGGDKITFDDVVGIDEAKADLLEIVAMLRNPERYTRVGADIPTGILLTGEPGTGKTYSARALANEAGVNFMFKAGSEFINKYVGQSAQNVKDFFAEAREKAPCIVFIDEIDALAGKRVDETQGADKETNGAVTQLLIEMDGLTESQDGSKPLVIVVGATNRTDALDPAVMRPGRFDRKIVINKPDVKGREKVLDLYIGKKKKKGVQYAPDIDIKLIAGKTTGMTPADLKNLVNEASILAARDSATTITMANFIKAIDRLQIGQERKIVLTDEEKKETAIHELGHALVGTLIPGGDPIGKITIIPRDIGALGVTTQEPSKDRYNWTKTQLEARIAMAMGGRVAERQWLGDITTGPSNDLEQARRIARAMVIQYGMSPELGPISQVESRQGNYLGGGGTIARDISPATQTKIDKAIRRIVEEQEARAEKILADNKAVLDQIVPILVQKETLEGPEFRELVKKFGGIIPSGGPGGGAGAPFVRAGGKKFVD